VIETYLANNGVIGRNVIEARVNVARRKTKGAIATLAADETFKKSSANCSRLAGDESGPAAGGF
jgi:hypothetical protein